GLEGSSTRIQVARRQEHALTEDLEIVPVFMIAVFHIAVHTRLAVDPRGTYAGIRGEAHGIDDKLPVITPLRRIPDGHQHSHPAIVKQHGIDTEINVLPTEVIEPVVFQVEVKAFTFGNEVVFAVAGSFPDQAVPL